MKAHPREHQLLAHLDGELTGAEAHDIVRHLAVCARCAALVSELRTTGALLSDAVQAFDAVEPDQWQHTDKRAAATRPRRTAESDRKNVATVPSGQVVQFPRVHAMQPGRAPRTRSLLRWAAGVALFTGTAASAMILHTALTDDRDLEPVVTTTASPAPAPPPLEAAVVVQPRDGTVHIALSNAGAGSRVLVTSEDRADVSIAVIGVAAPHFIAADGRVDVDVGDANARIQLVLPQSLRNATVTVDGATLITVRDGAVTPAHAATTGISIDSIASPRME